MGYRFFHFLRTAYKVLYPDKNSPLFEFKKQIVDSLSKVGLGESFMQRFLNDGFSGGEKKRMEVAQLLILQPKFAILDEVDSGLDLDSLKIVAGAIKKLVKKTGLGIIFITHYPRIFRFIRPDIVHVLIGGKIRASDGLNLVKKIEKYGYNSL